MLWNALPPRFGCAVSVINAQDNSLAQFSGREQVKVKVV
jgi:hypothetical protein